MIDASTEVGTALAQHVIAHALESEHVRITVPEKCEDKIYGATWSIDEIETTADGAVVVHAATDVTFTGDRTHRATRINPPEYETCHGSLLLSATADWSDSPLIGDCRAEIEYVGDRPSSAQPVADRHSEI